jgi:hypothetical protein
VSKPPEIKIDNGQLRIYVEVIAKWPRFDELMKGYDLMNGPVARGNPMSHAEFLNMVTPREFAQQRRHQADGNSHDGSGQLGGKGRHHQRPRSDLQREESARD